MAFGIPTTVKFPGVMMDIGHLRHNRIAKDGSLNTWVSYNRMRGQHASAMEHAIPEQFFTDTATCNAPGTPTPDPQKPDCPEGVSAVKAIAVAASQRQKVFTITPANAAVALPKLSHSASVMDEIRNAIATGKEVTISERRVTVGGWTGSGYTIVDPNTGAGAYVIEGANGGMLFGGASAIGLVGMFLLVNGIGPAIVATVLISFAIHLAVITLVDLIAAGDINPNDVFAGSLAGLALIRSIAYFLSVLGIAGFSVPGSVVIAIIGIALAVLNFGKIGK